MKNSDCIELVKLYERTILSNDTHTIHLKNNMFWIFEESLPLLKRVHAYVNNNLLFISCQLLIEWE